MAAVEPNSTMGVLGIQQNVLRREEEKIDGISTNESHLGVNKFFFEKTYQHNLCHPIIVL
jgi:hypothetical protein